jgi:PAS domain S-box-containing protein
MSEENRIKTEYGIGDIYKQLFDAAGEGLIISNSKGEIILSNPSANKIFGYDEIDALNGLTIDQLVPNDVRQQHVAHRKRFLDKPAKRTMGAGLTLFARKKDGSKVPVEISLNHFSRDGETFVMAMITDTTKIN